MSKNSLPHRKDIPKEETWNLESIFPSISEWEQAYIAVEAKLPELAAYQGRLGQSPSQLLGYFDLAHEVTIQAVKVMVYSGLDQ